MSNTVLASVHHGDRVLRVIDCDSKKGDPAQIDLFDPRRTADYEEKNQWMADVLEIILTRSQWWPSQLYERLSTLPFSPNWFGAVWSKAEAHGYKKIWTEHRSSPTESANCRAEFLWRKAQCP